MVKNPKQVKFTPLKDGLRVIKAVCKKACFKMKVTPGVGNEGDKTLQVSVWRKKKDPSVDQASFVLTISRHFHGGKKVHWSLLDRELVITVNHSRVKRSRLVTAASITAEAILKTYAAATPGTDDKKFPWMEWTAHPIKGIRSMNMSYNLSTGDEQDEATTVDITKKTVTIVLTVFFQKFFGLKKRD